MARNEVADKDQFITAPETKAIHIGQHPDPNSGAIVPPISLSTTFLMKGPGEMGDFDYVNFGSFQNFCSF